MASETQELLLIIRGRDKASAALQGVSKALGGLLGNIDKSKAAMAGLAAAFASAEAAAINMAGKFDEAMDRVQAVTGATAEDMEKIAGAVKRITKETRYDFEEVARAFEELGKAGVTVEESLNGAADAVLNLSAAVGEDLGKVAEDLTDILNSFNLSAEDAEHAADVLAKATTSASTSFGELTEALIKAGPIAKDAKLSLEEMAAALDIVANAGIKGSEAGRGLTRAFTEFSQLQVGTETDRMVAALERLGPAAQEAAEQVRQGKMNFMEFLEVLADIEPRFGDLVDLFGQFGAKVVSKLLPGLRDAKEGMGLFQEATANAKSEFERLVESFENAEGAADHMREIMEDNLPTAFDKLKASVKLLLVEMAGGTDKIKDAVEKVTDYINELADAFKEHGGFWKAFVEGWEEFGELIYEKFKELGDKIVEFFKGLAKRIAEALKQVWNTVLEGLATFFEKIPGVGKSIAEYLRGKEFELELDTQITAAIKLGDIQAETEKIEVTAEQAMANVKQATFDKARLLTISSPSIVNFTKANIDLPSASQLDSQFSDLSFQADSLTLSLGLTDDATQLAMAGLAKYGLAHDQAAQFVKEWQEALRKKQEQEAKRLEKLKKQQEELINSLDPLVDLTEEALGPLGVIVKDLHEGTFGLRTAFSVLANLIKQSKGYAHLVESINRLLQPLADALGAFCDALADAIDRAIGYTEEEGGGGEETSEEGFQSGGFTYGPTTAVAGVVHGGEWVAPAWMVDKYPALFMALERTRRGFQQGGFVGGYKLIVAAGDELQNTIEDAADRVAEAVEESGDNVVGAVASLNIPTGYKLARAAWGVATPGQPWYPPRPEEPGGGTGGGEEAGGEEPSGGERTGGEERKPPWYERVKEFWDSVINTTKEVADWIVRTFAWVDNFLKGLGLEESVRRLVELFLFIAGTRIAWQLLNMTVNWATDQITDLIVKLFSLAGDWLWGGIRAAGEAIWPHIQQAGMAIWPAIKAMAAAIWPSIQTIAGGAWNSIVGMASGAWSAIASSGIGMWALIGAGILAAACAIWPPVGEFVKNIFRGAFDFVAQAATGAFNLLYSVVRGIGDIFREILNGIISVINGFISFANFWIPDFIAIIPRIPYLQKGGKVLREGLVYAHADEFVLPPARVEPISSGFNYGGDIIFNNVTFNLPNVRDPEEFEAWIRRKNLRGTGRRVGTYAVAGR